MGGEHWLWDVDLWAESPGYEPNDLGSLGSTDGIGGFAGLTYRETVPGRVLRSYSLRIMSEQEWNYGGDWTAAWYGFFVSGQLLNFWRAEVGIDYNPQVLGHSLTRGGPIMRRSGFRGPFLFIGSPQGSRVQGSLRGGGGQVPAGGWSFWLEPSITYRPTDRLELSLEPEYSRSVDPRQYVATRSDGPQETYGSRYIFGQIERSELAARIRANYAISPDLTLEGYLEAFASSGQYGEFGELVAPRDHVLRPYDGDGSTITRTEIDEEGEREYRVIDRATSFTFSDPTFLVRSFRSNLVLRWEWRPGSTVFVVWQQDRSDGGVLGERAGVHDMVGSLRAEGDHFLALKATYWIPW
ncbi:MAG: hypothetical protein GEU90_17190 [Gemmatimonas sp.]|nr:hypothetical protein [Gemmatimonas sp.]